MLEWCRTLEGNMAVVGCLVGGTEGFQVLMALHEGSALVCCDDG